MDVKVVFLLTLSTLVDASELSQRELNANTHKELVGLSEILNPKTILAPNVSGRSTLCNLALIQYLNATVHLKQWALQMLDSTAKIPEGILYANHEFLGQYDECLAVESSTAPKFNGKHCVLQGTLGFHFPGTPEHQKPVFFYGLCIPSSCNADDLNVVLSLINNATDIVSIEADSNFCHTISGVTLEAGDWVVVGFMAFLGVLAGLSTIYDLWKGSAVKSSPLLTSFSLYKNGKALFGTSQGSDMMLCLNGIKVITMIWIVFFHVFTTEAAGPIINIIQTFAERSKPFYALLSSAYLAVDTFLLISGLLLTLSFFRTMTKSGSYDAPLGYIHRYFRLTPSYAMVLLFQVTVFRYIGDGPMWYFMQNSETSVCKQYWWTGLLYVQNFVNPDNLCLAQTWYLSADMQLHWIAPLILYPMWKWRKFAPYFISLIILTSAFIPFAISYVYGFAPIPLMDTTGNQNRLDNYPTYSRATPWLMGVALAYFMTELKNQKKTVQLSKMAQFVIWPIMGVIAGLCIFGLITFETDSTYQPGVDHSFAPAFFLAFHRLGWSISVCWLIFACVYGMGGPINTFLSWSFFIPLGRLTYGVYLTHVSVIVYKIGIMRTNMYFNLPELFFLFASIWVVSHLTGILLYLFIEAPFFVIDRHLLRNAKVMPLPRRKSVPSKPTPA